MKIDRKRLFRIIEPSGSGDRASTVYDAYMMVVILASLIPLAFKETTPFLNFLDKFPVAVFIVDYLLRLITADYKMNKGPVSFLLYPLTFMALIDLLCILPSFEIIASGFRILKVVRLLRSFRIFRAAKMLRYSKNLIIITDVIREQREPLLAVFALAIAYILVSALIVFNVEPDTFETFFDAVYWASVSLTTVGYGDIYPTSSAGRVITMLSTFFGVAVVALPSGILTAGYMDKLNRKKENDGKDA